MLSLVKKIRYFKKDNNISKLFKIKFLKYLYFFNSTVIDWYQKKLSNLYGKSALDFLEIKWKLSISKQ